MRLRHFEALRPVCPVCHDGGDDGSPLRIAEVARESGGHVLEAILHCSNPRCQREYPVIDGVPLLLANLRQFLAENALRLLARRDLSSSIESLVGDCLGPGSDFDNARQQVSAYVWEHYGGFDPDDRDQTGVRGTMLDALQAGIDLVGPLPEGPVLEVGCGPGGASFALAQRTEEMVLGVDLHLPMLRVAGGVLRDGWVRYDRRSVGLVYERRDFPVRPPLAENVDFWACDAISLPFLPSTFSVAVALNVLDCVYAPREFLTSLAGVLRQESGRAILTSPYDWSSGATPVEGWLGGHSQRSPARGSSEAAVRTLLTPGAPGAAENPLSLLSERGELPWNVRLHDRATMSYRLHLLVAGRAAADPPAA